MVLSRQGTPPNSPPSKGLVLTEIDSKLEEPLEEAGFEVLTGKKRPKVQPEAGVVEPHGKSRKKHEESLRNHQKKPSKTMKNHRKSAKIIRNPAFSTSSRVCRAGSRPAFWAQALLAPVSGEKGKLRAAPEASVLEPKAIVLDGFSTFSMGF